jgi:hypothetical protein
MKALQSSLNYLNGQNPSLYTRRRVIRHSVVVAIITLVLASGFGVPFGGTQASAHGGGLDSNGGHNCYVSACAGTYHCHQARGPRCGGGSNQSPSTPSPSRSSTASSTRPSVSLPRCVKTDGNGAYTMGEIGLIQSALRKFGYQPGPIDGIYGRITRSALNSFESAKGLGLSSSNMIYISTVWSLRIAC